MTSACLKKKFFIQVFFCSVKRQKLVSYFTYIPKLCILFKNLTEITLIYNPSGRLRSTSLTKTQRTRVTLVCKSQACTAAPLGTRWPLVPLSVPLLSCPEGGGLVAHWAGTQGHGCVRPGTWLLSWRSILDKDPSSPGGCWELQGTVQLSCSQG